MSARPKQRSSIARRAFFAALSGQFVLLAGLIALLYWAYLTLDTLLPALLGAPSWIGIQNIVIGLSLDLAPYAGGLLAFLLVLMWLLARWVARPLGQLVAAALALGSDGDQRTLPLRATGEVGQLARSFDDLSQSLQRSSRELQEQNHSLQETVRRLEGLLRISQELNATLDADQLIRRFATTLRDTFSYECVGVALVDGESLLYHFSGSAGGNTFAPPIRTPLTDTSVVGRVTLTGDALGVGDARAERALSLSPGLPSARLDRSTSRNSRRRHACMDDARRAARPSARNVDTCELAPVPFARPVAVAPAGRVEWERSPSWSPTGRATRPWSSRRSRFMRRRPRPT